MANEQEKLEARHQLLITLVHGTWGRGFFPGRQRQKRRPFWFEDGSPFLARLSDELSDISHKIRPLLWSGANSIFVRDETAHILAEHLSAEHAAHPQATQLVIAHSHGGNIALRALYHLRQRDASQQDGADSTNTLVVTLATPFIEVHQADFGRRPFMIRMALMLMFMMLPYLLAQLIVDTYGLGTHALTITLVIGVFGSAFAFWFNVWWIEGRAPVRQNQLDALYAIRRVHVSPTIVGNQSN